MSRAGVPSAQSTTHWGRNPRSLAEPPSMPTAVEINPAWARTARTTRAAPTARAGVPARRSRVPHTSPAADTAAMPKAVTSEQM
jgi:hypothetical protein